MMKCCFNTDHNNNVICLTTYYDNQCESYCNKSNPSEKGYPPFISCCPCCIPCLITIDLLLLPCFIYYKCNEKTIENTSYSI